jgi:tetratricopeptide (TPR) repeat protein
MSILAKWQRRWAILQLRKELRREPHISTFVSLVERHLFHGDVGKASHVVEQALRRYPDSERLAALEAQVRKAGLRAEIDQLRREIATSPTPGAIERLADVYLSLGEIGRALRLAAQCAKQFPNDATSAWIEGRIGIERYRKHGVAKEGRAAADALERVVRANPEHARAHRLLADFYVQIGALALARPHLEAVERSESTPETVGEAVEPSDAAVATDDLDRLLRDAESSRASQEGPLATAPDGEWLNRLRQQANHLVKTKRGIVAAYVLAPGDTLDPSRWEGASGKIAEIADSALHRMDLGGLHDFRLSGSFGHLVAFRSESCWLLFLCSESTRFETVMEAALEAVSEARVAGHEAVK